MLPLLVGHDAPVGLAALDNTLDEWLSEGLTARCSPDLALRSHGRGDDGEARLGVACGDSADSGDGCASVAGGSSNNFEGCRSPREVSAPDPSPSLLASRSPTISPSLAVEDAAERVDANGRLLLPSVRSGIEMALVHLVARASGMALGVAVSAETGLACRGSIEINALAARAERLAIGQVTV